MSSSNDALVGAVGMNARKRAVARDHRRASTSRRARVRGARRPSGSGSAVVPRAGGTTGGRAVPDRAPAAPAVRVHRRRRSLGCVRRIGACACHATEPRRGNRLNALARRHGPRRRARPLRAASDVRRSGPGGINGLRRLGARCPLRFARSHSTGLGRSSDRAAVRSRDHEQYSAVFRPAERDVQQPSLLGVGERPWSPR